MDTISKIKRSALMSRIRSVDTLPEMVVRRLLHGLGYRYVLYDKRLPGRPDLVFPARRKIILIHGCFWHGHTRKLASKPKSNVEFWSIIGNQKRDERNHRTLRQLGWTTLLVWECQVRAKDLGTLERRLGPLAQCPLDEPLGLAVSLRPIRPREAMADTQFSASLSEVLGAEGRAVIGQQPLNGYVQGTIVGQAI